MKKINKIYKIILILSILVISMISIYNYSIKIDVDLEKNDVYNLEKNQNMSNEKFIELLQKSSIDNNIEIVYKTGRYEGDKYINEYYITDNTEYSKDIIKLINKSNNKISIKEINDFSKVKKYELTSNNYYIRGNDKDILNFLKEVKENNISYEYVESANDISYYNSIYIIMIFEVILMLLQYLIILKQRKEIVILKINGYTNRDVFSKLIFKKMIQEFIFIFKSILKLMILFLIFNINNYSLIIIDTIKIYLSINLIYIILLMYLSNFNKLDIIYNRQKYKKKYL